MNSHDALVVGGGVIGCSIAFELARERLRVALLDRQEPMREASWAAAGMLSPAPDCPAAIPLVPLGQASLALYPNLVAVIQEASGQCVGYRTEGAIEVLCGSDAEQKLSVLLAVHRDLGLASEPVPLAELRDVEPGLTRNARAAALLREECSVEPRLLGSALLAAVASAGVRIYPGVHVASLVIEAGRCVGVKTSTGEVFRAGHVVLAAGCWTSQIPEAAACAPTRPVRGQMVALRHFGTPLRRVLRSEGGYIVPRGRGNPLAGGAPREAQTIVAGSTIENAGYEKRITAGGIEHILSAATELVPELSDAEVIETWCGLRPGTPDQLPILGPAQTEGLVFATGHYRNGILLAPITAKLVRQWIMENKTSSDWAAFSPQRFQTVKADQSARA